MSRLLEEGTYGLNWDLSILHIAPDEFSPPNITASISPEESAGTRCGTIGRSGPRLLMLDEPSMGLAPQMMVAQIFRTVRQLKKDGTTILLIEQNARAALKLADRAYVLDSGQVIAEGTRDALLGDERMRAAYIGR